MIGRKEFQQGVTIPASQIPPEEIRWKDARECLLMTGWRSRSIGQHVEQWDGVGRTRCLLLVPDTSAPIDDQYLLHSWRVRFMRDVYKGTERLLPLFDDETSEALELNRLIASIELKKFLLGQ